MKTISSEFSTLLSRWIVTVVAGLGWLLGDSCLAQESNLSWKFAEGDQFALKIVQDSTVDTSADRRKITETKQVTMDFDWTVEEVTDGVAKIRQVITRVQTTIVMPGKDGQQTIEYDSNNERHKGEARRLDKSFSKVVGQPVFVFMKTNGEIVDVEVPDETMEQMRNMPGSMQGRQMFELEQLKSTFANAGTMLPEQAGEDGMKWSTDREFSIGTPQMFKLTSNYTVGTKVGNSVPIKVESTLTPVAGEAQAAGDTIEFENLGIEDQEASGTIHFDTEAGNCIKGESTLTMKTKSQYRDMELKVAIKTTSTLTVERK